MTDNDKYLNAIEFDKIREILKNHCKTEGAKKLAQELIPYNSKDEIEFQIQLSTDAKLILDSEGINSPPFISSSNPDDILTTSRLALDDIINLTKTLTTSRRLKNYIQRTKEAKTLLNSYFDALISDKELEDKVYEVFDDNFNIKDDATLELKRLKCAYNAQNDNLKNSINNLLKDPDFNSHLQDSIYTQRFNRTVFQIKASDKSKVKGIVHDVSASNQTFFIEPEILVNINNKIRQIECEIEAEIERILYALSLEFHKIKAPLTIAFKAITELDLIFAKAKYSILTDSNPPIISDDRIIKLYGMRHPLLEGKCEVVKNDFELGENYKSLIITGSNTGGKTVAMKTAGLFIVMAKAGMHLPSDSAVIYPFKKVYSDIEERQDITQSLSTFSAHIKNISYIIDNATKDDLILFDELGAGTDPEEGTCIARAILEYLRKEDVLVISTTHLGELKILEYENPYYKNASVEFDRDTMNPTYKLLIGLAGSSYAIDVAKKYGLKEEIINSARENLNNNSNPDTKIFNKIQETHQKLLSHTKKIEESKESAVKREDELKEQLRDIKAKKKKTLDSFKKKYQSNLENARDEIKHTLDELRKEKSEKIARRAYSRLAKLENAIREEFVRDEDEISEKYPKIDWNEIKIGQNVLVTGINQPAILKTYPDSKNMVEIQIGLIKSKIHISKLAKTDKKVSKGIKKLSVSFDDFTNSLSFNPRLDLRGMRVDEAIDAVEHHLDLAIRRNISQFTIIHGHGTGALKSAVRDYLKDSPYVLKYRIGTDTEGGDGVCIVDVK